MPFEADIKFVVILVFLGIIALYWLLLPSVIPGIPHARFSNLHPLGDALNVSKHYQRYGETTDFMITQCLRQKSPIIQLFLRGRTFVVVSDMREAQDVCSRRTTDFDHADIANEMFQYSIPNATVTMRSHAEFRAQRKSWGGIMSTHFLHTVAAPYIYKSSLELIRLWHSKAMLGGREYSFHAVSDIRHSIMDNLWEITCGVSMGILRQQVELLSRTSEIALPVSVDLPLDLPVAEIPPLADACERIVETIDPFYSSPAPGLQRWFMTKTTAYRRAVKMKNAAMGNMIRISRERYAMNKTLDDDTSQPKSAIDFALQREAQLAKSNEGFEGWTDDRLQDELLSFLMAGLETTSVTLTWTLKFLSDIPQCQIKLRDALHKAFPEDEKAGTIPSVERLLQTTVPYLEAVIAETLRISRVFPGLIRQANVDAELLGHIIPRGTTVIFALGGDSLLYNDNGPSVPEDRRSASSRTAKSSLPRSWSNERKRDFWPERWLGKNDDGQEVFDIHAGPSLPFGVGPRGCFGQKLAMIQLRFALLAMVWTCEFGQVPEALRGYEVIEAITRRPVQDYIKVRPLIRLP